MIRNDRRRIFGRTILGCSLLLSALVTAPSCSSKQESLVSPCESELSCGQACDATNACATGQFCGTSKTCTAECVPGDSRCGKGKSCNGTGRCVMGPGVILPGVGTGGTSGGGVGGGSSTGGNCPGADVALDGQLPTVLLLVDQSSSMNAEFGTSDRWQTLRTSLMTAPTGIVSSLQAQVRFGLSLYSGRNGMAPCPELTNVAPALNNYPAIDAAYPVPTAAIIDDTPTGESIDAAVQTLLAVQEKGPKVIVLATDGEPDTCAIPDGDGDGAREVAVKAAQDAFAAGVFTFYISVGNEISEQHATEMANVGQGYPRTDPMPRFYRANNQAELASAFDTIVEGVRSCNFALDGAVKAGRESEGVVVLNGTPLVFNDPNGWSLISPTTVQVSGTACDTVLDKNSTYSLSAKFPCGVVVPVKVPK